MDGRTDGDVFAAWINDHILTVDGNRRRRRTFPFVDFPSLLARDLSLRARVCPAEAAPRNHNTAAI
jgi:hypothetical protein